MSSAPNSEQGRLTKNQRHYRIGQLLENNLVTSQAQLVELLSTLGVAATQATVSRDLEEMGAVKVRVPGGETVYAIPEMSHERIAPEDHLHRVFSEWVVDVTSSANIVILRTPPGSAHVVASALDRAAQPFVLGTVAGDDTVMVVVPEGPKGHDAAIRLRTLAGLEDH